MSERSEPPIPNISAGKPKGDGPRPVRRPKGEPAKKRQIWCAYKPDASDFVVFSTELDAMRYAVRHGMLCEAVAFGLSLREQTASAADA